MISILANAIINHIRLITVNAIQPKVYTTDESALAHCPLLLLGSLYHELRSRCTAGVIRSKCGRRPGNIWSEYSR